MSDKKHKIEPVAKTADVEPAADSWSVNSRAFSCLARMVGDFGSTLELKEVLTAQLSEYISSPQVSIIVSEMRGNIASVIGGGVARSGVVPLQRNTRVIDAIATLGGFTTFAKKDDVRVLRETKEGRQVESRFDYDAFIKGRAPEAEWKRKKPEPRPEPVPVQRLWIRIARVGEAPRIE